MDTWGWVGLEDSGSITALGSLAKGPSILQYPAPPTAQLTPPFELNITAELSTHKWYPGKMLKLNACREWRASWRASVVLRFDWNRKSEHKLKEEGLSWGPHRTQTPLRIKAARMERLREVSRGLRSLNEYDDSDVAKGIYMHNKEACVRYIHVFIYEGNGMRVRGEEKYNPHRHPAA